MRINTAGQMGLSVAMQQQCRLLFVTQSGNKTISVYKVRIEADGPHIIIILAIKSLNRLRSGRTTHGSFITSESNCDGIT